MTEKLKQKIVSTMDFLSFDTEGLDGNSSIDSVKALSRINRMLKSDHLLNEQLLNAQATESTASEIPAFYSRLPKADEIIELKIRECAREIHISKKGNDSSLSHEELTELYTVFEKYANPPFPGDGDTKYMGFRKYKEMVETLNPSYQELLTTPDGHPAFVTLITDDPYMRVPVETLFTYVMRKTWQRQTRITLSLYDDNGEGFIKDQQLENYIRDLIPTLTQLKGIEPTFEPFYLCAAAAKFLFFLDTNRTRKIKIVDILASGLIDELLDLRELIPRPVPSWFTLESTLRIYTQFIDLDKNRDGMLCADEFLYYSNGGMNLTPAFVNRIFEECLTYDDGKIDFRTYAELVLAFENPKELQSLKLYFKFLDIHQKGYLDAFTLQYFYKDILEMMTVHNTERVSFNDIKDEIFDMIKPLDPLKITLKDLVTSGCGHILFSVFTDFNGFYAHEYREAYAESGTVKLGLSPA